MVPRRMWRTPPSDLRSSWSPRNRPANPVEVVTAILAAHQAGDPLNRIAKNLGNHHSAVSRVLAGAEVHRQGALQVRKGVLP